MQKEHSFSAGFASGLSLTQVTTQISTDLIQLATQNSTDLIQLATQNSTDLIQLAMPVEVLCVGDACSVCGQEQAARSS
jgi:hypothetical protein